MVGTSIYATAERRRSSRKVPGMSNNYGKHLGREVVVKATKLGAAGTADGVRDLISITPAREDWMARGECRILVEAGLMEADDWFSPDEQGSGPVKWNPLALKACRSCAVRRECADYGIRNEERGGIWGGLTPNLRTRRTRKIKD